MLYCDITAWLKPANTLFDRLLNQTSNMEHDFWHQRWENNQIGFHLPEANPLLVRYLSALDLNKGARIFLPLCGKTLDIAWLLAQGFRVAGAELSRIAVEDLFNHLNLTPTITTLGDITRFSAENLDLYVGDIFNLSPEMLGSVDAIYDRAALVALPEEMRKRYVAHLITLTQTAQQLLICFDYDQNLHAGPPFSVCTDQVVEYYQQHYATTLLATVEVNGGIKGKCRADEQVWYLKPFND